MRKVWLYSFLLTAGVIISQFLSGRTRMLIELATMFSLSFIVIHVGFGFEISRSQPGMIFWDNVVSAAITVCPWFLCTAYFVFAMAPRELWWSRDMWWEAVVVGRFAAPTSVGLLFSMLAAAGLSATWLYRKARVLAIFDDLDTILLFIPFKIFLLSMNWQLVVLMLCILTLIWLVWKFVHVLNLPVSWPWVMLYSAIIVAISEGTSLGGKVIDDTVSVEVESLLLAFVVGCMLARAPRRRARLSDNGSDNGLADAMEQRVSTIVSACFMALSGMCMPALAGFPGQGVQPTGDIVPKFEGISPGVLALKHQFPGWGLIAVHVLVITALSNIGKMVPALCYRKEASRNERLALGVGMFPRGEVGAGMLVVSLSYNVAGPILTVAVISLAVNLLCSGFFVFVIKRLVAPRD